MALTSMQSAPSQHLACAVLLAAALGCGAAGAQSVHPVNIAVVPVGTTPMPPGVCTTKQGFVICVSEDPIDLSKDVEPVVITWNFTSPNWTFVKNKGIVIKKGKWKIAEKSGTDYAASQKKDGLIYKYDINCTNADGTVTINWDPTIKNN